MRSILVFSEFAIEYSLVCGPMGPKGERMERNWYKNVIVYTVDVKSYCDSNDDGIGDFQGLISKLNYLSDLGITCLWLLPFFPSPWRDNGYDVTDYYNVDPRLGTILDFQELTRRAAERGIQIVIDLVMNHTSDLHPWFLAAKRDAGSMFRDYYVWTDVPPPADPNDRPSFCDSEHGVWEFNESAGAYYYHKFYHFQPDLNLANPKVREEAHKIIDYWLSFGISGFRLDAAPIMIQKKGLERTRPSNSQDILRDFRSLVSARRKGAVLMGEVDVEGHELIDYFSEGGGLHLVFNFLLNAYLLGSIAEENKKILIRGWRELPIIPESGNWLNFLRNLDELNISQLPESIRERVYSILGPDSDMRIYGRGIRRRLAPMLEGNHRRIEMAFSLLFSLPGTPMVSYGDEIGMGENLELQEREGVRTPMQWSNGHNAGFSRAPEGQLYRALVKDKNYHCSRINVADQQADPESLLNKMKKLIYARKMHPEIGFGKMSWVATSHPSIVAHLCHWKNDMLMAVHNLCASETDVTLDMKTIYAKRLKLVMGDVEAQAHEEGNYFMHLRPYEYAWFSVHYEKGD